MIRRGSGQHVLKGWIQSRGWILERRHPSRELQRRLDAAEVLMSQLLREAGADELARDLWDFVSREGTRSQARSFDDLFAWWSLQSARRPFFIEAGCWDPVYRNNTVLLERHLGWEGVLIEASPTWWGAIKAERTSPLIRSALVPTSMSARTVSIDLSGASSSTTREVGAKTPRTDAVVDVITLPEVLERVPLECSTFLSLDIEGGEVEILRDLPLCGLRVEAISVEALNWTDRETIFQVMEDQGFRNVLSPLSHYNQWFIRRGI
jgi:hypothetical protein